MPTANPAMHLGFEAVATFNGHRVNEHDTGLRHHFTAYTAQDALLDRRDHPRPAEPAVRPWQVTRRVLAQAQHFLGDPKIDRPLKHRVHSLLRQRGVH